MGTIIAKFYDPHEGIDMFSVFLFTPWRQFDCAKAMVRYVDKDDTSFLVLEIQVWACTFMSSSPKVSYESIGDSNYVPSASFGIYVWIKCMVKYTKKYSHI